MKPSFGEWIKQLRKDRAEKMTQDDLARMVGVSKGYISQIENDSSPSTGLPPRVSDEHLRALAAALDVDEHEMFSRATDVVPAGFCIMPAEGQPVNSAGMLVRQLLADYPGGGEITTSQANEISEELEDFARVRIGRRIHQFQSQTGGMQQKQSQKQEKTAA